MTSNEYFTLIPGRTARQGTSLNEGKRKPEYLDETNIAFLDLADMTRLGLSAGQRIRLVSEHGSAEFQCKPGPKDELAPGLIFVPYGPNVCQLIGGETHGTGMPDSKCIEVRIDSWPKSEPRTNSQQPV